MTTARFIRDQSGNVALLFALILPMLLVGAALGVDSASLYLQRRQLQGALDLATMAAASDPSRAFAIVQRELLAAGAIPQGTTEAALRSGAGGLHLVVEAGRYSADPSVAPSTRFTQGASPPNAVRANLSRTGTLLFAHNWATPPDIGVASVAAAEAEGSFTLGSRLARVGGGLPAAVLGGLLGSGVTLDVMSYDRLLGARVTLLGVFQNLAQDLSLGAVTYDRLFESRVTEGNLARAIASSLAGLERSAMLQIAASIGAGADIPLARVIDLGEWGAASVGQDVPGLGAEIGALDLLGVAAALSDGRHQVALNLAAALPGLASLSARLTVGEPPQSSGWLAVGQKGAAVRTTQLRLQLDAVVGGGATLQGAGIAVPITLDLAFAEARIAALTCPSSAAPNGGASIETRPGVARLVLGTVTQAAIQDFGRPLTASPATMVNVPLLLQITGRAQTELASNASRMLAFSSADIGAGAIKTARSTGMVQAATATLLDTLVLDVRVLGLGLLPTGVLSAAVRTAIAPLAPVLDATIDAVLGVLGISLGEADVQVLGVRCSRPVLVQ